MIMMMLVVAVPVTVMVMVMMVLLAMAAWSRGCRPHTDFLYPEDLRGGIEEDGMGVRWFVDARKES